MKTSFKAVAIKDEKITKFPSIGVLDDAFKTTADRELVVLFTAKKVGTVLHAESAGIWKLGSFITNWDMDQFRKLRPGEEIIIKG